MDKELCFVSARLGREWDIVIKRLYTANSFQCGLGSILCARLYCHVLTCTCFSYQRRGPERLYLEPPAAGPAGLCPCSLWSRHGRTSRSTACACWLQEGKGQEKKHHLHLFVFYHLSLRSGLNMQLRDVRWVRMTEWKQKLFCCVDVIPLWLMCCFFFFFFFFLADRTADGSLRVRGKLFPFSFTWLVWLWKVSVQNTTNKQKKLLNKRINL